MLNQSADDVLPHGTKVEYNATSPLEPLDPTKFRNIMVDKQEVHVLPSRQSTADGFDRPQSSANVDMGNRQPGVEMPSRNNSFEAGSRSQQMQLQVNTTTNSSSNNNVFVHPRHLAAGQAAAFGQGQMAAQQKMPAHQSQQQMSNQQQYFVAMHQMAHPYGNMPPSGPTIQPYGAIPHHQQQPMVPAPSVQAHQTMNYIVQGAPPQPHWVQQAPQQPQYISAPANVAQLRMPSPQQQQHPQCVIPKQQQQQMNAYSAEGAPIAYPVPHIHQAAGQPHQQRMAYAPQYAPHSHPAFGVPPAFDSRDFSAAAAMHSGSLASPSLHAEAAQSGVAQQQMKKTQPPQQQHLLVHGSPAECAQQPQLQPSGASFATPSQYIRPHHPSAAVAQEFGPVHHQGQQMLRLPPSHPLLQQQQFFGHDPNMATTLNPDICLAGCVFLIVDDCDPKLVDNTMLPNVIHFYGGDIESNNPRGIPERVTHVVCSSWTDNEQLIQQALTTGFVDRMPRKLKRVVTLNWLNDAIEKRRVNPPSKACHLPSSLSVAKQNAHTFSKAISAHGFEKRETLILKHMVHAIGARFIGGLAHKSDFVVVRKSAYSEELLQRANARKSCPVNFQWLVELYFGNLSVLSAPDHQRFSPNNENPSLSVSNCQPQALARISDLCHKFMVPWTHPISLNDEVVKMAHELKNNVRNDVTAFPEKQFSIGENAPNEEQIKQANFVYMAAGQKSKIVVFFEALYPEQIDNLSRKVRFLGGHVCQSVLECTHFVTTSLQRSVNLVEAFARARNIVTPLWIEASFKLMHFTEELDYFVRDRDNEKRYGYSLKATILRARHRRIFEGVKFHLSPGVQPSLKLIKRLVEAAGGSVETGRPKKKELLRRIRDDETYFVVCNKNDLSLYQYLVNCNFPIFNEDFLLMAIVRHKIELCAEEYHCYPSQTLPVLNNKALC